MPMTALLSTPHLELLDCLIATDLEVDRLRAELRGLDRRLAAARRHTAGPEARTPLRSAYLRRVEAEYEEVVGQLHEARRVAQVLVRIG
jgi:hypothetical protein